VKNFEPGTYQVNIYSTSGKLEYSSELNSGQIDVSNLSSGTYLLRLLSGNKEVGSQKFIKVD
jgi:hypothetical protein